MSLFTHSGNWFRFKFDVPPETSRAIDSMRRPGLRGDVERFLNQVVKQLGENAQSLAKRALDSATVQSRLGIEPAHVISAMVRSNTSRRNNPLALRDRGWLREGVRAVPNRASLSVTLGVVGPHADIARFHEEGFKIKVTPELAYRFRVNSREAVMESDYQNKRGDVVRSRTANKNAEGWNALEQWANRHEGQYVDVAARPVLRRAMERTVEAFHSTEGGAFLNGIMKTWVYPIGGVGAPSGTEVQIRRASGEG